jgi:DNA repair protein RadA/Sms
MAEEPVEPHRGIAEASVAEHHAVPIAEVDVTGAAPVPVGIPELDRVLVGGLVPGSVTLVSGEPGIGKSTLLLQAASGMVTAGATVLYVSAEEAVTQVRRRAERLGTMPAGLLLTGDASVDAIEAAIDAHRPSAVVVDSIQTVFDSTVASGAGSVAQVRACAHRLAARARSRGTSLVLIGHVTKDGAVAGPRVLEHLVDTVLSFEGDRHHELRFLRATKHRFGPTDELGVFTMGAAGLEGIADAGGLFLSDRRVEVPGSVVVPVLDGLRPLLVEVQALTFDNGGASPNRTVQGVDRGRLEMVLAVLAQRAGIRAIAGDVYVSVAGGLRAVEPGVDLGVAVAVASAAMGVAVRPDVVVCGELGLVGEVRQVRAIGRRIGEAARLGFTSAVVPAGTPDLPDAPGITLVRVADLSEALWRLFPGEAEVPRSNTIPDLHVLRHA